jgi:hypothetical protein
MPSKCVLLCVLWALFPSLSFAASVTEVSTGITLTMNPGGEYTVESTDPPFRFGGNLDSYLTDLGTGSGADRIGRYQQISFRYQTNGARAASLRLYADRPVVLFSIQYLEPAPNLLRFPGLTTYPRNLFHLAFDGLFGAYRYDLLAGDSPWVFFDGQANTFILSAASHFDTAATTVRNTTGIEVGVNPAIASLPQDFQFDTILVIGKGINQTFETWGHALTDLGGKTRPSNDADTMLTRLGYWTDAGSAYYYRWEAALGYPGTLQRVKEEFDRKGIPLGYMQLDSWFYPKGRGARWDDATGGIYRYEADASLFPGSLRSFQQNLGIPLVAHGRWIDTMSPYRQQYKMSSDVSIDVNYWDAVADYLRSSGAVTYEQDWLGTSQANLNLSDRAAYLDNMAQAGMERKITILYCMPLPRHYLQSSSLDNVTTIRTSDDRFSRGRWDQFLYGSRFASALGLWPWSDVAMSYEPDNLLLATLSAGPVGVGDKLGDVTADYLLRAVRSDGVIVKPDAPIVPVDDVLLGDAQGDNGPMVAVTHTDFDQSRALYVFAYQRGANANFWFTPASLGLPGAAYVYNYFSGTGTVIDAGATVQDTLVDRGYYIVAPVGPSGIAFLGDAGQFVPLGKKRIAALRDDGVVQATVLFAPGETSRTLFGYSPAAPVVTATNGSAGIPAYDENSRLFRVDVTPGDDGSAVVTIR